MQGGGNVGRGFEGEKVFVSVGIHGWGEGVLAMVEHGMRVVGSEAARLGAEVEEEAIRFPAAESADGSLVNAGYEKGSCSTGS